MYCGHAPPSLKRWTNGNSTGDLWIRSQNILKLAVVACLLLDPWCSWMGPSPLARPRCARSLRLATAGERFAKQAKEAKTLYPPKRRLSIEDVELRFSRSSGPGGQNVNKVETKAQARFHVQNAKFLPDWVKQNLLQQEANRVNKHGVLVVHCEEQRTRLDNQRIVLQKLQAMIDQASFIPEAPDPRKVQKMRAVRNAANQKRLQDKKFKSMKLKQWREKKDARNS